MLELQAKLRSAKDKNNQIRKQGFVPAILYGPKIKNTSVMVKQNDLDKTYKEAGESTLLKLEVKDSDKKGEKENLVLIHDIARDPVSDQIIHVDFYQPRLDVAITAEVSLEFIGQSPAVDTLGGILIKNIHQVEVEALPQNLPRAIEVDISSLKTFDDIIHIKDLKMAAEAKINAEPDEVVALVESPRTEEELEKLEEAPQEKIEEVEVEAEEKKKVEAEEETEKKEESE